MSNIILKFYTQFGISFDFGFWKNYIFVKLFEQFFIIFKNLKVAYNIIKDKLDIIINYNSGCRKPKSTV